jgi:hypothetical protein
MHLLPCLVGALIARGQPATATQDLMFAVNFRSEMKQGQRTRTPCAEEPWTFAERVNARAAEIAAEGCAEARRGA